jgi:DNA-binding NarL/FixJ family response regulator
MPIRVLIVDDHDVVRDGIRSMLRGTDFEIIGEVGDAGEVSAKISQLSPDVVLLDCRLGNVDGLTLVGGLRSGSSPVNVLVFTAHDNAVAEARAYQAGANGYLQKSATRQQLLSALGEVGGGKVLWTSSDQRRLNVFLRNPNPAATDHPPLTKREHDILCTMVEGLTNKEIGEKFGISAETVKEHVQHLFRKIGVSDRTQAAVWAVRNGIC